MEGRGGGRDKERYRETDRQTDRDRERETAPNYLNAWRFFSVAASSRDAVGTPSHVSLQSMSCVIKT